MSGVVQEDRSRRFSTHTATAERATPRAFRRPRCPAPMLLEARTDASLARSELDTAVASAVQQERARIVAALRNVPEREADGFPDVCREVADFIEQMPYRDSFLKWGGA